MIEIIRTIGKVLQESDYVDKLDFVSLVQKSVNEEGTTRHDAILVVNIDEKPDACGNFVSVSEIEYTHTVFRDSLSYLDGPIFIGAAVRSEKYFGDSAAKKANKNNTVVSDEAINKNKNYCITVCMNFLEVSLEHVQAARLLIDEYVKNNENKKFIITFTKNGEKAIALHKDKFIEKFRDNLGRVKSAGNCHLCGEYVNERYETCAYKCYTNDKNIFNKTDELSYGICESCLETVLCGRYYAKKHLTTSWAGSKILILPTEFTQDTMNIFGDSKNNSLINRLYNDEDDVFASLGACNTGINIIFFTEGKSDWKITYSTNDVNASRFAKIASLKHKYRKKWNTRDKITGELLVNEAENLSMVVILQYMAGVKQTADDKPKFGATFDSGEAKKHLNAILHGTKINRRDFFTRAMGIYDQKFLNGHKSMMTINRVYNFLVECGCLDNPWKMPLHDEDIYMKTYKTRDEFFADNDKFFDIDAKKAWFLLGSLYKKMIWASKRGTQKDGEKPKQSYLEKNFFYNKSFDYATFLRMVGKCAELSYKYGMGDQRHVKDITVPLKEYAVDVVSMKKLSPAEAKYIFSWGMDQWFEKNVESEDEEIEDEEIEVDE